VARTGDDRADGEPGNARDDRGAGAVVVMAIVVRYRRGGGNQRGSGEAGAEERFLDQVHVVSPLPGGRSDSIAAITLWHRVHL
jgi:hypothetical protein